MSDRCLLTVHAHPDDESSKGAGTVAKYHDQGVRTVLVCCTGGEEGDILNPAMDRDDVRADLPAGYDEVVMLGYRDSGMPDTEANARPEAFANAPLDEAVGRLVEVIRRERPQVVVTYGDDQQGYPHPDHLMVHDITMPAIDRAADPEWYPKAGPPHQVLKVYWTTWSRARMVAMHEKFLELGLESPFDEKWFERPATDEKITTQVSIEDYGDVRWDALLAHATFWFGLPRDVAAALHPWDDYQLARSEVPSDESKGDLFDGIA